MTGLKKYLGLATLVAVVAALGISSAAMAQSSTTPTPSAPTAPTAPSGAPLWHHGGFGLRSQAALDAAAKALGMTSDELQAQLWGGKTLAAIADEKGVDIADVQKAVEAAQLAEMKTAIQDAVKAGTLTQDKANWLIEGLDKGYWGAGKDAGFGFGFGMRMGGRGHGGFGFGTPPTAPNSNNGTTTPNSGTTTPSGLVF